MLLGCLRRPRGAENSSPSKWLVSVYSSFLWVWGKLLQRGIQVLQGFRRSVTGLLKSTFKHFRKCLKAADRKLSLLHWTINLRCFQMFLESCSDCSVAQEAITSTKKGRLNRCESSIQFQVAAFESSRDFGTFSGVHQSRADCLTLSTSDSDPTCQGFTVFQWAACLDLRYYGSNSTVPSHGLDDM